MSSEYTKAQAWRESLGLSRPQLAKLTGYSWRSILWFERGRTPSGGEIAQEVWTRYRRICHSVTMELKGSTFSW